MGEPLTLDDAALARLKKFHDDGLVWLVNTAILHPRGLAIAIHVDEDSVPVGLSIVGEGDEPWVFGPNADAALREVESTVRGYLDAEGRREHEWSERLRG